ncbi:hypothetical protein AMTRI_Chr02g255760 [Amborella trichopoda]
MDMNLDTRYTIDLQLGSKTPIGDYPTEVDYDDLGYHNEMEDINDFDSDGSNKFDICQYTKDASETNMDEPQGFELSDNVPNEDFKSHNKTPVMKTASRMEKQMVEIYTPTIFSNFFQPKLMEGISLTCEVQVFFLKTIFELPQYYIMKRLTTKGIARNSHGVQVQPNCEHTYSTRYNDLFRCCNILSVNGAVSVGLYEYAKMVIDEACDKVAARIDMEMASAIQASPTHSSPAYTGSPCVTPILSVVSNPHVTI